MPYLPYKMRCTDKASNNMKCFAMMQVRDKVKFCVGFVLKYTCVNYENTQ